jgi:hypothetical protein
MGYDYLSFIQAVVSKSEQINEDKYNAECKMAQTKIETYSRGRKETMQDFIKSE